MVQDDVGLNAINDLIYLECTTYRLLRKYFRHLPYYTDLLDLFHDVCNFTVTTSLPWRSSYYDSVVAHYINMDFGFESMGRNGVLKRSA